MRRDLVERALASIRGVIFVDVDFTPVSGSARRITKAISGVEVAAEEPEYLGRPARVGTHVTYAPRGLFPDIGKGALLSELDGTGNSVGDYRVLDVKPWGDGRLEIAISLEPV